MHISNAAIEFRRATGSPHYELRSTGRSSYTKVRWGKHKHNEQDHRHSLGLQHEWERWRSLKLVATVWWQLFVKHAPPLSSPLPPAKLSAKPQGARRAREANSPSELLAGVLLVCYIGWQATPQLSASWQRISFSPADNQARQSSVYYPDCNAARAAGVAPIYAGQPGYREEMDGDLDGIACEPYRYTGLSMTLGLEVLETLCEPILIRVVLGSARQSDLLAVLKLNSLLEHWAIVDGQQCV